MLAECVYLVFRVAGGNQKSGCWLNAGQFDIVHRQTQIVKKTRTNN